MCGGPRAVKLPAPIARLSLAPSGFGPPVARIAHRGSRGHLICMTRDPFVDPSAALLAQLHSTDRHIRSCSSRLVPVWVLACLCVASKVLSNVTRSDFFFLLRTWYIHCYAHGVIWASNATCSPRARPTEYWHAPGDLRPGLSCNTNSVAG